MGLLNGFSFGSGGSQGGGLLDLIRQVQQQPQVQPSQGFADVPSSFQSVGNYQMPIFGQAPAPDPTAIPPNAQLAQGVLPQRGQQQLQAGNNPAALPIMARLQQQSPDVGDRLLAGVEGFAAGPGLLSKLTGTVRGFSGQSGGNQAQEALVNHGLDPAIARQVARSPEMMRSILPSLIKGNLTDEVKEHREAVKQGFKSNLFEYKMALARARATNVNQNVSTGEKSYDQALNKDLADVFLGYQKSGRTAANAKNTLDLMESLTNDPNFYSGAASPLVTRGKQALVSLGIADPKAATPNEVFESLGNKLVMDSQGGSLGAQISNADVKYIAATVPGLEKTPEGNRQIIGVQRKLYQRQQDVAKMARDYAARNGGRLDYRFDEQLADYANKNPLFPASKAAPGKTKSGVGWSIVQ